MLRKWEVDKDDDDDGVTLSLSPDIPHYKRRSSTQPHRDIGLFSQHEAIISVPTGLWTTWGQCPSFPPPSAYTDLAAS